VEEDREVSDSLDCGMGTKVSGCTGLLEGLRDLCAA